MAKIRTYKCPSCQGTFNHLHHPSTDTDPPRFCVLCGFDTQDPTETKQAFTGAITAPHIAKSIGKVADATYRDMENASLDRIAQAAEMTGQPESDFNDLKITNLNDGLRQGDIAAPTPPANPVSDMIKAAPQTFGHQSAETAMGFAAAAHTGKDAYAGLNARNALKAHHANHRLVDRHGNMSAAPPVSESPSLEVVNREKMLQQRPGRR